MLRLAAWLALPLLHLLLHAIDATVYLVDPLTVLLRLTGRSLSLSQRLAGSALDSAEAAVHAVDAGIHGSDLLPDEALCGATAKARGANQNQGDRGKFRKIETHILTFPNVDRIFHPMPAAHDNRF
jgi:hypothetical protein